MYSIYWWALSELPNKGDYVQFDENLYEVIVVTHVINSDEQSIVISMRQI